MGKLKKQTNWVLIDRTALTETARIKVPGGWLYRHLLAKEGAQLHVSLQFVPAPRKPRKVVVQ